LTHDFAVVSDVNGQALLAKSLDFTTDAFLETFADHIEAFLQEFGIRIVIRHRLPAPAFGVLSQALWAWLITLLRTTHFLAIQYFRKRPVNRVDEN
jgi:hypothetical protein